jgi:hypothetical protein
VSPSISFRGGHLLLTLIPLAIKKDIPTLYTLLPGNQEARDDVKSSLFYYTYSYVLMLYPSSFLIRENDVDVLKSKYDAIVKSAVRHIPIVVVSSDDRVYKGAWSPGLGHTRSPTSIVQRDLKKKTLAVC